MIETLFYFCYYAYLRGDLAQAIMYYELLKEEFQSNLGALKEHQLKELKKVKEAIKTGNLPRGDWLSDTHTQGPPTQPTAIFRQDDLVRKIDYNFRQLKDLLQEKNLYLYNLEHPCDPYGAVDMVYMGRKTVYPVEVKKDQGRHDLIGQIMKYDLYHRFRLHYHHYDFVQGITICSSYDPFTLRELKRLGIKTLLYSITENELNLKQL